MIPTLLLSEISSLPDPVLEVEIQEKVLADTAKRFESSLYTGEDFEELLRICRKNYAAASIFRTNVNLSSFEKQLKLAHHANTSEEEEDFI